MVFRQNISKLMIDTLVGGMVKVPALNVVDHGFNPWSGQIKDFKYDIYYFSKQTTLWSIRAKTG